MVMVEVREEKVGDGVSRETSGREEVLPHGLAVKARVWVAVWAVDVVEVEVVDGVILPQATLKPGSQVPCLLKL